MASDQLNKTISLVIQTDTSSFDKSISDMQHGLGKTTSEINKLDPKLIEMANSMNKAETETVTFSQKVENFNATLKKAGSGVANFQGAISNANSKISDIGKSALKTQAIITGLGTVFSTVAAKKAIDLEFTISSLNKVLSIQERELLPDIIHGVEELATVYGRTDAELIDAVTVFKQAGFSVAEAAELQKVALDFAIAGNIEAAESADYLTKVVKGFRIPNEDAAKSALHFADAMNEVSNRTAASADKIAQAVSILSPIAQSAGFSFDETIGLVVPIIEVFGSGHEAAIALKTGLLKLSDDTKPLQRQLKHLGISQLEANGNMRTARDIFLDVARSFQTMEDANKNYITQALVGIDQSARLSTVFDQLNKIMDITDIAVNASAGGFNKFNDEVRPVGSAANEVSIKLQATKTAVDRAAVSFDQMLVAIGNKFLPGIFSVSEGLIGLNKNLVKMLTSADESSPVIKLINDLFEDLKFEIISLGEALPVAFAAADFSPLIKSILSLKTSISSLFAPEEGVERAKQLQSVIQQIIDTSSTFITFTEKILTTLISSFQNFMVPLIQKLNELNEAKDAVGSVLGLSIVLERTLSIASAVIGALTGLTIAIGILTAVLGANFISAIGGAIGRLGVLGTVMGSYTIQATAATTANVAATGSFAALGASLQSLTSVISLKLLGALGLVAAAVTGVYFAVEKLKDSNNDFSDSLGNIVTALPRWLWLQSDVNDVLKEAEEQQKQVIKEFQSYNNAVSIADKTLHSYHKTADDTTKTSERLVEINHDLERVQTQLNKKVKQSNEIKQLQNQLIFNANKQSEIELAIRQQEIALTETLIALRSQDVSQDDSRTSDEVTTQLIEQRQLIESLLGTRTQINQLNQDITNLKEAARGDENDVKIKAAYEQLVIATRSNVELEKQYQELLKSSNAPELIKQQTQQLAVLLRLKNENNQFELRGIEISQDIQAVKNGEATSRVKALEAQKALLQEQQAAELEQIRIETEKQVLTKSLQASNEEIYNIKLKLANATDKTTRLEQLAQEQESNTISIREKGNEILILQNKLQEKSIQLRSESLDENAANIQVSNFNNQLVKQNQLFEESFTIQDKIKQARTELANLETSNSVSQEERAGLIQKIQALNTRNLNIEKEIQDIIANSQAPEIIQQQIELTRQIVAAKKEQIALEKEGLSITDETIATEKESAEANTKAGLQTRLEAAETNKVFIARQAILRENIEILDRNLDIERKQLELGQLNTVILEAEKTGQNNLADILKEKYNTISNNIESLKVENEESQRQIDIALRLGLGYANINDELRANVLIEQKRLDALQNISNIESSLIRQQQIQNEIIALNTQIKNENQKIELLKSEAEIVSGERKIALENDIASAISSVNALSNRRTIITKEGALLDEEVKSQALLNLANQIKLQDGYNQSIAQTDVGKLISYNEQLSEQQLKLTANLLDSEASADNLQQALILLAQVSGQNLLNLSEDAKNELKSLIRVNEGVITSIGDLNKKVLAEQQDTINQLNTEQINFIRNILGSEATAENIEQAVIIAAARAGKVLTELSREQQSQLIEITNGTISRIGEITDTYLIKQENAATTTFETLVPVQKEAVRNISDNYQSLLLTQKSVTQKLEEIENAKNRSIESESKALKESIVEIEQTKTDDIKSINTELANTIASLEEEKAAKTQDINEQLTQLPQDKAAETLAIETKLQNDLIAAEQEYRDDIASLTEERFEIEQQYQRDRLELQAQFADEYLNFETDIQNDVKEIIQDRIEEEKDLLSSLTDELTSLTESLAETEIDDFVSQQIAKVEGSKIDIELQINEDANQEILEVEKNLADEINGYFSEAANYIAGINDEAAEEIKVATQDNAASIIEIEQDTAEEIVGIEQDTAAAISKIKNDTAEEIVGINESLTESLKNIAQTYEDEIISIEQETKASLLDSENSYQDSILEANKTNENNITSIKEEAANDITAIKEETAQDIIDIESDTAETIVGIEKTLEDEITNINNDIASNITDLKRDASDEIAEINQDIADSILAIEETTADDIASINAETAQTIQDIYASTIESREQLEIDYFANIETAHENHRENIIDALNDSLDREQEKYEQHQENIQSIQDEIASETARQSENVFESSLEGLDDDAKNDKIKNRITELTGDFNKAIADFDYSGAEEIARAQEDLINDLSSNITIGDLEFDVETDNLISETYDRINEALQGQLEAEQQASEEQLARVREVEDALQDISSTIGEITSSENLLLMRIDDEVLQNSFQTALDGLQEQLENFAAENTLNLENLIVSEDIQIAAAEIDQASSIDEIETSRLESLAEIENQRIASEERIADIQNQLEQDIANERIDQDERIANANITRDQQIATAQIELNEQIAAANEEQINNIAEVELQRQQDIAEAQEEYSQNIANIESDYQSQLEEIELTRIENINEAELNRDASISEARLEQEQLIQEAQNSRIELIATAENEQAENIAAARLENDELISDAKIELENEIAEIEKERIENITAAEIEASEEIANINREREEELTELRAQQINDQQILNAIDDLQDRFREAFDVTFIEDGLERIDFSVANDIIDAQQELANELSDDTAAEIIIETNIDEITERQSDELNSLINEQESNINSLESDLDNVGNSVGEAVSTALSELSELSADDIVSKQEVISNLEESLSTIGEEAGIDLTEEINEIIESLTELSETQQDTLSDVSETAEAGINEVNNNIISTQEQYQATRQQLLEESAVAIEEINQQYLELEAELNQEKLDIIKEYNNKIIDETQTAADEQQAIIEQAQADKEAAIIASEEKITTVLETEIRKRERQLVRLENAINSFEKKVKQQLTGVTGREGVKGVSAEELVEFAIVETNKKQQQGTTEGQAVDLFSEALRERLKQEGNFGNLLNQSEASTESINEVQQTAKSIAQQVANVGQPKTVPTTTFQDATAAQLSQPSKQLPITQQVQTGELNLAPQSAQEISNAVTSEVPVIDVDSFASSVSASLTTSTAMTNLNNGIDQLSKASSNDTNISKKNSDSMSEMVKQQTAQNSDSTFQGDLINEINESVKEILNLAQNNQSDTGAQQIGVNVNLTGAQQELQIFVEKLIKLARFNAVYQGSEFLIGT